MPDVTDKTKKRIESLSTGDMLLEINLGRRSHFQRESFAYLKTCYQLRTASKEPTSTTNKSKTELDASLYADGTTWVDDAYSENSIPIKKRKNNKFLKISVLIVTLVFLPILVGIAIYEYQKYREAPIQSEQRKEQPTQETQQ